jgi:hypothetical protein
MYIKIYIYHRYARLVQIVQTSDVESECESEPKKETVNIDDENHDLNDVDDKSLLLNNQ